MAHQTTRLSYRLGRQRFPRVRPDGCGGFAAIGFGVLAALAIAGSAGHAPAADERFEVTSIKAVRPTLADTVAALQQRDVARAKAAFEAYDSAWNGIEVYINTRSKEMYDFLEHNYQRKIAKALDAAEPRHGGAARRRPGHARQVRRSDRPRQQGAAAQSALRRRRAAAHRARPPARGDPGAEGRQRRQGAQVLRGVRRRTGTASRISSRRVPTTTTSPSRRA